MERRSLDLPYTLNTLPEQAIERLRGAIEWMKQPQHPAAVMDHFGIGRTFKDIHPSLGYVNVCPEGYNIFRVNMGFSYVPDNERDPHYRMVVDYDLVDGKVVIKNSRIDTSYGVWFERCPTARECVLLRALVKKAGYSVYDYWQSANTFSVKAFGECVSPDGTGAATLIANYRKVFDFNHTDRYKTARERTVLPDGWRG